jgi:uncharacterized membrane protein
MGTIRSEYRIMAGVCYVIWPLSLYIVMTGLKKDKFLKYHGYQALFLGICGFVFYLVAGALIRIIPVIGVLLFNLMVLVWILFVGYLFYRCLKGEYFKVPLIYDLAQGNME